METVHDHGTPLAAYLEGQGSYDPDLDQETHRPSDPSAAPTATALPPTYAPHVHKDAITKGMRRSMAPVLLRSGKESTITRIHHAWSTALNSRLGRADNARFLEHFRYIIVASQLLNEYLDYGLIQAGANYAPMRLDGAQDESSVPNVTTSLYGAIGSALLAFALVGVINWARHRKNGAVSKGRVALAICAILLIGLLGYAYMRRQWLKFVRRQAVAAVTDLTTNWQAFELSTSSALSLIQEVELVSKGYRLTTPLPPATRIEDNGAGRRCGRLRKALHRVFEAVIPACVEEYTLLLNLIDEDDLEKYMEVYDVSSQDAKEALGSGGLESIEDDAESLKSLRLFSYRAGVLRRTTLCALMSLEADGGKPDFARWRLATEAMRTVSGVLGSSAEKLRTVMAEMETLTVPPTPISPSRTGGHGPAREKMRSQVRKISMLSSGIRALQAKMQVLREETNRSIEQQEDLTDLGPSLMAQYESIGADLKELVQAWEAGKASLQSNLTKQERRISRASSSAASGLLSPTSSSFGGSLGGLTAVEEGGTPSDALRALTGEGGSNRSSMVTPSSEDEEQVFEAIAVPRQRSSLTREERIAKMQEERERQATIRAKRETNTTMLRELESVINLRPRAKTGTARVTSI